MKRQQHILVGCVAIASGIATVLLLLLPRRDWALERPALRVAIETAAALVALLAGYLVLGRYRRNARLDLLFLLAGLAALALSNFAFGALPIAFADVSNRSASQWAAVAGQLLGAVLFGVAALAPTRATPRPGSTVAVALTATLGGLLIGELVAVLLPQLPATVRSGGATGPDLHAHALVTVANIAAFVAFAVAAFGFTRRWEQGRDPLLGWLAVGSVLAAFARLNYLLLPSLYSNWVGVGDVFRVLFYCALLVAELREIHAYWRSFAEAAVLAERRRIARELHDGVAQELAFVVRTARRLAGKSDDPAPTQIAAAADRALADSRRAIAALTRPLDEPLEVALAQAIEEVAFRVGASVDVALAPGVQVDALTREALIRIASEAVGNAGRHGGASSICVELTNGATRTLRVVDNGRGFDPGDAARINPFGYGLTSMRDRAEAVGCRYVLRSAPGHGTEVEVKLP
jgi:signal transduction histidine kinase